MEEKNIIFTKFRRNRKWEFDRVRELMDKCSVELLEIKPNAYDDDVMKVSCTEENYKKFAELVEKEYPNVCIFDYLPKGYYFKRLGR